MTNATTNDPVAPLEGMKDVLPEDVGYWQRLERTAAELFAGYGYREMRVPVVEQTALFRRSIGEFTDIVEKEMFTFADRDGHTQLTLRPEATAGVIRAMIHHGLLHNQKQRVWTSGPMFRGERPQKGRYRQFQQIDVEAFGHEGPDVDAEVILLGARLWQRLGIAGLKLEINSLGTPESRRSYRERLVEYFGAHRDELDADSQRRLGGNPLRILDSKNPAMQKIIAGAPRLADSLDPESRAHFEQLLSLLTGAGLKWEINPRLVRGLDYYTRTVFEWTTDLLGSQSSVCSGGRYDGLVEHLGGAPTPGIGWALGEERVVLVMKELGLPGDVIGPQVYCVVVGEAAGQAAMFLCERLRDAHPGLRIELNLGGGNFKTQFRRADRSGAAVALVLGDDEASRGTVAIRSLRTEGPQVECAQAELAQRLLEWLPALATSARPG
ncbi:MAG TPA: histidine--tRNA ligase [Steroidobacteraceae bacterium]|nr:histidine--tRNA ligase [Steroidobacteraceae bacterium]